VLRQLAKAKVGFKNPKAQALGWVVGILHGKLSERRPLLAHGILGRTLSKYLIRIAIPGYSYSTRKASIVH
jgi:hypothetical protein